MAGSSGGVEEKRPAAKKKPRGKAGIGGSAARKLSVRKTRLVLLALLAAATVVIGGVALLGGDSGDGSSGDTGDQGNAVALTASQLPARASALGQPAYWLGPRAGTESYELSTTPDGRVYVRYLTNGAEAGDPRPDFVTVGTYQVDEAEQALRDAAENSRGSQALSQEDGYQLLSSGQATNAYVVFDEQPDVQVEIFSPQPGEAAALAKSGALGPIR